MIYVFCRLSCAQVSRCNVPVTESHRTPRGSSRSSSPLASTPAPGKTVPHAAFKVRQKWQEDTEVQQASRGLSTNT